jgi:hypothetical protein
MRQAAEAAEKSCSILLGASMRLPAKRTSFTSFTSSAATIASANNSSSPSAPPPARPAIRTLPAGSYTSPVSSASRCGEQGSMHVTSESQLQALVSRPPQSPTPSPRGATSAPSTPSPGPAVRPSPSPTMTMARASAPDKPPPLAARPVHVAPATSGHYGQARPSWEWPGPPAAAQPQAYHPAPPPPATAGSVYHPSAARRVLDRVATVVGSRPTSGSSSNVSPFGGFTRR